MKTKLKFKKEAFLFFVLFICFSNTFAQCDTCYIKAEQKGNCKSGVVILEAKSNINFDGWYDINGNLIDRNKITSVKSENAAIYIAKAKSPGSNLIVNSGFESGNSGFESDYSYYAGTTSKNSFYIIDSNPNDYVGAYVKQKDITSGSGNMMIVDGNINNTKAAYRSIIGVQKGTDYQVSIWVSNIHDEFAKPSPDTTKQNVPVIQLFIDDSLQLTYPMPLDTVWHRLKLNWTSSKTSNIKFEIKTRSTSVKGNDFALDEIKFVGAGQVCDTIAVSSCNNIEPVVTPDGDGHYDTYFIQEQGTAKIIDLNGNVINEIISPANWDGTSRNGAVADAGYYAIVVNNTIYRVSLIR